MRLLQRNAEVTTRYGGGFVQSIDGVAGGTRGGRPVDWFFYVNGHRGRRRAPRRPRCATATASGGTTTTGSAADGVPAVVGSVPRAVHARPRRQAPAGARGVHRPATRAACTTVRDALVELRRAPPPRGGAAVGAGRARRCACSSGRGRALRGDRAAQRLEKGPGEPAASTRASPRDGRSIALLDARGAHGAHARRRQRAWSPRRGSRARQPVWVVTGHRRRRGRAPPPARSSEGALRRPLRRRGRRRAGRWRCRTAAGATGDLPPPRQPAARRARRRRRRRGACALAAAALAAEHPLVLVALAGRGARGARPRARRRRARSRGSPRCACRSRSLVALDQPVRRARGADGLRRASARSRRSASVDLTVEALVYGVVLGAAARRRSSPPSRCFTAAVDPDEVLRLFRRVSFRSRAGRGAGHAARAGARRATRGGMAEARRCRPSRGRARARVAVLRAVAAGALDRALDVAATLEVRGYGAARRARGRRRPAVVAPRPRVRRLGGRARRADSRCSRDRRDRGASTAYPALDVDAGAGGGRSRRGGRSLVVALAPFADRRGIER